MSHRPSCRTRILAAAAMTLVAFGSASHARTANTRDAMAAKILESPRLQKSHRIFEIPSIGFVEARETARSHDVWEGRIVGRAFEGLILEIRTSFGLATVLRGDDGRMIQSIPGVGGRLVTHIGQAPNAACCDADTPPETEGDGGPISLRGGECNTPYRIDLLVKWTPLAEIESGGPDIIRSIAEASVAMTNHTYIHSGISTRVRAVGYGVTEDYDQDAGNDVLNHLTDPADGWLDQVHADRDQVGADVVALLTGDNPGICGRAWILTDNFPAYAFGITDWNCAVGNLTFTHELGHNQGCCHARGDGGGCQNGGIYNYSVGHRFFGESTDQWRTVMAYSPGIRWPRVSNPNVTLDGVATGLPGDDGNDNALTIDQTTSMLGAYRCEVLPDDDSAYHIMSGLLPVPVNGDTTIFSATGVPTAAEGTEVVVRINAIADLGVDGEFYALAIGGTDLGPILGATGSDCRAASDELAIPASTFNQALAFGDVEFAIIASGAVDPVCNGSELMIDVRYVADAACGSIDTDDDGEPDCSDGCPNDPTKTDPGACGCGIADVDSDEDGIYDCDETCPADFNNDGVVRGPDLGIFLLEAGTTCDPDLPCLADLDGDGVVRGGDLGLLLLAWGPCP